MKDTAQIIIVSVITVLTLILSIVGVQIILILQEIKKSLGKVNTIIEDTQSVTSKIARSTSSVTGMLVGLKTALSLFGSFKKKHE
jgi:uncharacterized BrkB/YihY/UPF0761 family membrane protein